MAGQMYASSPTWYCGNAIDSDERGILYFVGNCSLFLLDFSCTPPRYVLNLQVCRTRATGVSVCKAAGPWRCVTAGDGRVRLWDLQTKQSTVEHSAHKNVAVSCISWSQSDSNLVVSGDGNGNIVAWRPNSNTCQVYRHENVHVSSLACSPHIPQHVAVGYKDSTVVVLDLDQGGAVVQRLRGHDEEIQGLCWCPDTGEDLMAEEADGAGCLLATGSKDRTIRVWASSSGRCLFSLTLPPAGGSKRDKGEERFGGGAKLWLTLHWPQNTPRCLFSSSYNGEVLRWDLSHTGKQKWQVFTQSRFASTHKRMVFNLVTGGSDHGTLCSVSMDRQVVLWDVREGKARYNMATLGGFAYCAQQSPINPGLLAVGCGDHLIRIWNVENPHNPCDAQVYWQGLKSKVTALNWHPVKEGKLGYGTDDGRVGVYDLFSKSPKLSGTFHKGTVYTVVWGPPCDVPGGTSDRKYCLYSCGDGRIMQHDPDCMDKHAFNVMEHVRGINGIQGHVPVHSEINWKPDYKAFAIGNDDGSVQVFSYPALRLLCKVHVHRKLINAIRWHPQYTAESEGESAYRHWMATASCGNLVQVVDLSHVFESELKEAPLITQATCELAAHNNRVTSLAWSSFTDARLASASYDHSAQIWDVKAGQPVANYRGHRGRLLCVQWSELDADVVYSGGQDNTLQCWRVSEQTNALPVQGANGFFGVEDKKNKKKNKKKKKDFPETDTNSATRDAPRDSTDMAEIQRLIEAKKSELARLQDTAGNGGDIHKVDGGGEKQIVAAESPAGASGGRSQSVSSGRRDSEDGEPAALSGAPYLPGAAQSAAGDITDILGAALSAGADHTDTQTIEEVVVTKGDKVKKKKRHKSLFPTSALRDNRGKALLHDDCLTLAQLHFHAGAETRTKRRAALGEDWFQLGHFVDRSATYELLRYEMAYHMKTGNWDQYMLLELFRGNLPAAVAKARKDGRLTDWLLGLSPVATTAAWRELCEAYAQQLSKEQLYHQAASYLLAANKVYDAIETLRQGALYKDALILARMRLAPQDPAIPQLLRTWASALTREASFELAAKCHLALGEALDAARCLARRSDTSSICTATMVCVQALQEEQAHVYCERMVQECLAEHDWETAQRGVNSSPAFQHYSLLVCTHEVLVTELVRLGALPEVTMETAQPSQSAATPPAHQLPVLLLTSDTRDVINPWPACTLNGQCCAHALVRAWVEQCALCLEIDTLRKIYARLRGCKPQKQGVLQMSQVLQSVAYDVSLGILQVLLGDGNMAAHHWSVALETAVNQGQQGVATGLCQLLLPLGPGHLQKLFQQIYALSVSVNKEAVASDNALSFTLDHCHARNGPHLTHNSAEPETASSNQGNQVCCDSKDIHAWDSLQANYSYCVLIYWQEKVKEMSYKSSKPADGSWTGGAFSSPRIPRSLGKSVNITSPKQSPHAGSRPKLDSNLQTVSPRSTDSVEDIVNALEDSQREGLIPLSEEALYELSRNLLWNIQVRKHKIQDSLSFIQKAVSELVSKNRSETKSTCSDTSAPSIEHNWRIPKDSTRDSDGYHGDWSSNTAPPLTTPTKADTPASVALHRTASGEYLSMDGSRAKKGLFRSKPHHSIIDNDSVGTAYERGLSDEQNGGHADEYVPPDPMTPVKDPDQIYLSEKSEQKVVSDDVVRRNNEGSYVDPSGARSEDKETKVYLRALSIFSDDTSNSNDNSKIDTAAQSPISKSKQELLSQKTDSVNEADENISVPPVDSVSAYADPAYLGLPEDWFRLPIDVKYSHACAGMDVLSAEQSRLQRDLQQLDAQVKSLPFPHPMESAHLLQALQAHVCDVTTFSKHLQSWLNEHAYLSRAQPL